MISLLLDGYAAPASFAVGGTYSLGFEIDGLTPLLVRWSLGRRTEVASSGVDALVFSPLAVEPYYLHVEVVAPSGTTEETIFVLPVTSTGASADTVSISWSDPLPKTKAPLTAQISVSGQPKSLAWSLLFNNVPIEAGTGGTVNIHVVQPGIFRILATVVDSLGNTVVGDSAITVQAPFGLQSAILPPQPAGTLQYLGEVYSPLIEGGQVQSSYLPYELISLTNDTKLLPGTTHFQVDLDPLHNTVDDEVVVRTAHGNWTLKGPPSGLATEALAYDYQHGQPIQPAALDLNVRYTAEAWNVHGSVAEAFRFRVRFKCYRASPALFRYAPCDWSAYYGGQGQRQRRVIGLFTAVDAMLDAEWPDNRLKSTNLETFTVPNQHLVIGQFTTTGRPDRPLFQEDHFFTDQNAMARYESPDGVLGDLTVSCSYGLVGVRPCYLDFTQPAKPRIVQKLKRLYGKLVLYVGGGVFTAGTVVTVRVYTGKSPGYVDLTVPVLETVYNPDFTRYAKFAELAVDLSDFEFDRMGVLMSFTADETSAVSGTSTSYNPLHQVGDDAYYTGINAPAIQVDTACYRDPVPVAIFDGTFAGSAVPLPDCNRLACGPVGLYCYTLLSGSVSVNIAQPLGFPAPFVAYTADQSLCYSNPIFLYEITTESAGSNPTFGYTGTTGCGVGYRYDACNLSRSLAVIYPQPSVPHPTVSFGGTCWGFSGSVADLRPFQVVTAQDVTAVTSCIDTVCTGSDASGASVLYMDPETFSPVTVQFHHLDLGIPAFGVAAEAFSTGYSATPPGHLKYSIWSTERTRLMTASEDAAVRFAVTPNGIWRSLVISRADQRLRYQLSPGISHLVLDVRAGDSVTLEFGNFFRQYKGQSGEVSWEKIVQVPNVYDTATLSFSGSQAITALGFCGLTNRQDYTFYSALPADAQMDLPNPDTLVTATDGILPEMVVVRAQSVNENRVGLGLPVYAGQRFTSPITFRFYAGRSRAGQHGEMDVWLENDQSFPPNLKVSPYKVLTYGAYSYRKTAQFGDTTRRSLRTVASAAGLVLPRVYSDDRGERISARATSDYVFVDQQPYVFNGTVDTGISESVRGSLETLGSPELVSNIGLNGSPQGLAYVPVTDEIWAATSAGIEITPASAGGGVTLISVPAQYAVAWCAATGEVITAQTDGTIRAYNPITKTQTKSGSIGATSGISVYLAVIGSTIYAAANATDVKLFKLASSDLAVLNTYTTGSSVSLYGLIYVAATGQLLLGTESGGSWGFDPNTSVLANLGIPGTTLWGFAYAADRNSVYITSASFPGSVMELDPVAHTATHLFSTPNSARNPFWHPLRKKVYYGQYVTGYDNVIDPNGNLLTQVYVGEWSFASAYVAAHRYLFRTVPALNAISVMT